MMGDERTMRNGSVQTGEETRLLVQDFINSKLEDHGGVARQPPLRTPTSLSRKVQEVSNDFEQKYRTSLNEMFDRLRELENDGDVSAHGAFEGVINELFNEGVTWSRIVAMFAFSAGLVQRYPQDSEQIIEDLTEYIEKILQPWISVNGGWNGFFEFSDGRGRNGMLDSEMASPWRRIFGGIAAGVLGAVTIGALLTTRT